MQTIFSKIIALIILWSAGFAVWAFANPPSGAPGTTSGLISAVNGNIGVGTTNPQYKLHVVGTGVATQSIYSDNLTNGGMARFGLKNTNRNWSISNYGDSFLPNGAFVIADETAGQARFVITTDGRVAIGHTNPLAILDINGIDNPNSAMIIRNGSLDMTNGKIKNLGNPTDPQDAATKNYVDGNPSNAGNKSATKVWGEAREGVTVVNDAGECTNIVNGETIKISRSNQLTSWDGSAAACPRNWWVCKASERGAGSCASGSQTRTVVSCVFDVDGKNFASVIAQTVWLNDGGPSGSYYEGTHMNASGGLTGHEPVCSLLPVWCCKDIN